VEVSQQFNRTILRGGEIVLNLIAEPGHSAVVPASLAGANVTRDVAVIPVCGANARFVNYYLQSPQCIDWLRAHLQGSVTLKINLGTLAALPVPAPPEDEQQRVVAVLGALDDKIESNRRLVALIPQLIRATVVNALDEEPTEVAVAELARFVNGGAYTKGASGTGRIVIRIAELNSGPGGSTVYNDIDVPDEKTARPGDILMSWSGSLGVYRWVLPEAIINQHIFKVIPVEEFPAWLVFDRLDAIIHVFQRIAKDKATTMGHIQRGHLTSTTVGVPAPDVIRKLDGQMQPLWERLLVAEQENLRLAALRDVLLPELLSGRLRLPHAVGAVA
jgi:type I restriction enzyme S subunit